METFTDELRTYPGSALDLMSWGEGVAEEMVLPVVHFPAPHAAQQMILDSKARFKVVNFGRQAGKTTLAKRLCAETGLAGQGAAYVVPLFRTQEQVFLDLEEALKPFITSSQQNKRINLRGGGFIEFWSLHNGGDRARGRVYHRVVMDECAMVPGVLAIWETVWRMTLARHRGDAYFFSTPRRGGGFQKLHERGGEEDWESWTIDTSANPFITKEEMEAIRRGMSAQRFAQEVMADFEASDSELVYPQFSAYRHVKPAPCSWEECKWRVMAIDPGGGDPTAIYAIGVSVDERVHVYAPEFYQRGGVSTSDMASWIQRFESVGKVQRVVVGETGGSTIVTGLRQLGIRAVQAEMHRDEGKENVRFLLDNDRLTVDSKCEEMIAEFGLYRWRLKKDPYEADMYMTSMAGERHGDAMDALRYGVAAVITSLRGARPHVVEQRRERASVR